MPAAATPAPTFRISVEAVRFSKDAGSPFSVMHWEPMAYLDDPSVRITRKVEARTVAELADLVEGMLLAFGYDAKAFVTLLSGRSPRGFKDVRSWGKNDSGALHSHYA